MAGLRFRFSATRLGFRGSGRTEVRGSQRFETDDDHHSVRNLPLELDPLFAKSGTPRLLGSQLTMAFPVIPHDRRQQGYSGLRPCITRISTTMMANTSSR